MNTRDPQCIFCRVVSAEIPSAVVFEDGSVLAFLDTGPLADGHLLVVPREHAALLTDLSADAAARLGSVLPRLGRALLQVTGAAGFNVLLNNGSVAGQVVNHVHVHLIPRRESDGLGYRWNAGKYTAGRADQLAVDMQDALRKPE